MKGDAISETTAIILAIIVFVAAIIIVILAKTYSPYILSDLINALSFNWLFGKI
ncbi:MAG: hypothetical protein QXL76_00155 [Candidatus Rehaiarchaeum fermentans]|nr:hypothetical protein [Candidatus Rehaiarchaeum fermentans]